MSIQTMKLALEALENPWKAKPEGVANAITALRQAIEQAEKQEPVAHWSDCAVHSEPAYPKGECDCGGYAPPQHQWVGLTEDEAKKIETIMIYGNWTRFQIIQHIEAQLKDKNT